MTATTYLLLRVSTPRRVSVKPSRLRLSDTLPLSRSRSYDQAWRSHLLGSGYGSTSSSDATGALRSMHRRSCSSLSALPRTGPYGVRGFASSVTPFEFEDIFQSEFDDMTEWVKDEELSKLITTKIIDGKSYTQIAPEALERATEKAVFRIQHYFRKSHLLCLYRIMHDPEATDNDRYVASELLKNAKVSAKGVLPSCQDTGTVTVLGKRGFRVITDEEDSRNISKGVYHAYQKGNLRYSQVAAQTFFTETNTRTNLPAQIDIMGVPGDEYTMLVVAKGGGSANKTQLFQQTKALLNEKAFDSFIKEQLMKIGTAACPPYHLAVVVGGLSADMTLKTLKLASCKYYDGLPHTGSKFGRAFRDFAMEERIQLFARKIGIGAQFGGKYFLHDVRVIRLPRHGASCPVSIGVSCSADRQTLVKIKADGLYFEQLVEDPEELARQVSENASSLDSYEDPEKLDRQWELDLEAMRKGGPIAKKSFKSSKSAHASFESLRTPSEGDIEANKSTSVPINMEDPIEDILKTLSQHPIKTRLALSGTIIVARDIAHARLKARIDSGGDLPDYFKKYPIYYAGPAKTPPGLPSGSFGPTTAARMDPYVEPFQKLGGSMIMIGKGNRTTAVTESCAKYGGFYLGSPGGIAATMTSNCIKSIEVLDMKELGMEAVWKIVVEDFPAFIIVDDKGNDFFREFSGDVELGAEVNSAVYSVLDFFELLDTAGNHDGMIDPEEMVNGFDDMDMDKAEALIKKYSLGMSKSLNLDEFITMILKEDSLRIEGQHALEKLSPSYAESLKGPLH